MTEVFLDTSFAIALSATTDQSHARADHLYNAAFDLFRNRLDKEWGLIDCVSFVVMQKRGIFDALTTDEHFSQAGFRALLRR